MEDLLVVVVIIRDNQGKRAVASLIAPVGISTVNNVPFALCFCFSLLQERNPLMDDREYQSDLTSSTTGSKNTTSLGHHLALLSLFCPWSQIPNGDCIALP
jgi:hypothetical protein